MSTPCLPSQRLIVSMFQVKTAPTKRIPNTLEKPGREMYKTSIDSGEVNKVMPLPLPSSDRVRG